MRSVRPPHSDSSYVGFLRISEVVVVVGVSSKCRYLVLVYRYAYHQEVPY